MTAFPSVTVFALGGTIASVTDSSSGGVSPGLTGEQLVRSVPGLDREVDIVARQLRQVASPDLTLTDVLAVHYAIQQAVAEGCAGVVVTQGTDTLEETAFALDLLHNLPEPVAVTGAMRNPTLPGADGPGNVAAAVHVAASPSCRSLGTVVVFNDEIHSPRVVRKTHTSNCATFSSGPVAGPLGWVSEGQARILFRPVARPTLQLPADAAIPDVALLGMALGDDGRLLDHVATTGYRGLVVEAFGGGHVPSRIVGRLQDLAQRIPVVLASRTGSGQVLNDTYGFPGSERDLLARGLLPAGHLDGRKSRILLSLLLAADPSRERAESRFMQMSLPL